MDYAMIGKVEKAKFYAQEPQRVTFNSFSAIFRGDNDTYEITLNAEGWHCSCSGYHEHGMCPHVMTMERVLCDMLKRPLTPYATGQNIVSDVDKSIRYADEPERVTFTAFEVMFDGDHNAHVVSYDNGTWEANDKFFHDRGYSSHTMAMERILGVMLKP